MPPKETASVKYFIVTDKDHYVPLEAISDVEISTEDISDMVYERFDFDGEIEIEIQPPKNHRELKPFIELFHPSLPWLSWWLNRYDNNNWRRLHGLPLVRRMKNKTTLTAKCRHNK